MDNFMDKIAQKFNASELIKANSQAEAEELKRLQSQIAAYESILQEMRKLNLRTAEMTGRMEQLSAIDLDAAIADIGDKNKKLVEETLQEIKVMIADTQKEEPTEVSDQIRKMLEEKQEKVEELFHAADEYVHRENVKVYRNVQAVVVDELKNQTEALILENEKVDKKMKLLNNFMIGVLALNVINMVLIILQIFI